MTDLPEHRTPPPQPDVDLEGAVDRLCREFAGVSSRETVAATVADSRARLGNARIQLYLPLLSWRFARERLRASGTVSGALPRTAPEVLFVCTHNAARSQLAAALLRHRSQGRVVVRSAGTKPVAAVDVNVLQVLTDAGIEADDAYPKPLVAESVEAADVIVTMGCGDACPVLPGRRYLDWDLPDPAGARPEVAQAVFDRLQVLVDGRLTDLLPAGATP